jgi:phosphoribosylaminoimidazole-succinocarboxamide synthase
VSPSTVLVSTQLGDRQPDRRGKVRDIFDQGDNLLIVASDRLSAFDVVLPTGIPDKGTVLTQLSLFWFHLTRDIIANHWITSDVSRYPSELQPYVETLRGRSMLTRRARVAPIECVVRGYLAGSGWKEYQKSQSVCGIPLPAGLVESSKLPEPLFTPATKEESGHDINISFERTVEIVGERVATQLRDATLGVYRKAAEYAAERGILIADTKFEFGYLGEELILVDEVLTPDSSRFWDAVSYEPGKSQDSFDKQYVRDYLETLAWDKTYPGPELPPEVVERTSQKYREAYRRIVGRDLCV